MRIYLSGSFSGWQDSVIQNLGEEHYLIDPREHEDIDDPAVYVPLDLHYVRQCDVVLAYLEEANPSGVGLACEVSYAFGLGKTVVLVNEKSHNKYWAFLDGLAHFVCETLPEAIELIGRMQV